MNVIMYAYLEHCKDLKYCNTFTPEVIHVVLVYAQFHA